MLQILIIAVYQTAALFCLILILSYLFRWKDFEQVKKYLVNKLIIVTLVGIVLEAMFFFQISNQMLILLIIFPLAAFYLDITISIIFYGFVFLGNICFYNYTDTLFLYVILIAVSYLSFKLINNMKVKYFLTFLFTLIFMNIELVFYNSNLHMYLFFNALGITVWISAILLLYYYRKKYKLFYNYQKKSFIDRDTNIKNYYCLINNSHNWLKDKYENITVLLINVDRLRDINNLYGKDCGNTVIKLVIESIISSTNDYGDIYRLDGDTFCIVVANEKLKVMQTISEKIRLDIEKKDLIVDNNKIKISVSIGGYHGKIVSKNIDDYIELAQEALINSKYIGRNKVVFNKLII